MPADFLAFPVKLRKGFYIVLFQTIDMNSGSEPNSRQLRIAILMLMVITAFTICWIPFATATVIWPFFTDQTPPFALLTLAAICGKSSVVINPIICGCNATSFHATVLRLKNAGNGECVVLCHTMSCSSCFTITLKGKSGQKKLLICYQFKYADHCCILSFLFSISFCRFLVPENRRNTKYARIDSRGILQYLLVMTRSLRDT
jgi:hypothetical protein